MKVSIVKLAIAAAAASITSVTAQSFQPIGCFNEQGSSGLIESDWTKLTDDPAANCAKKCNFASGAVDGFGILWKQGNLFDCFCNVKGKKTSSNQCNLCSTTGKTQCGYADPRVTTQPATVFVFGKASLANVNQLDGTKASSSPASRPIQNNADIDPAPEPKPRERARVVTAKPSPPPSPTPSPSPSPSPVERRPVRNSPSPSPAVIIAEEEDPQRTAAKSPVSGQQGNDPIIEAPPVSSPDPVPEPVNSPAPANSPAPIVNIPPALPSPSAEPIPSPATTSAPPVAPVSRITPNNNILKQEAKPTQSSSKLVVNSPTNNVVRPDITPVPENSPNNSEVSQDQSPASSKFPVGVTVGLACAALTVFIVGGVVYHRRRASIEEDPTKKKGGDSIIGNIFKGNGFGGNVFGLAAGGNAYGRNGYRIPSSDSTISWTISEVSTVIDRERTITGPPPLTAARSSAVSDATSLDIELNTASSTDTIQPTLVVIEHSDKKVDMATTEKPLLISPASPPLAKLQELALAALTVDTRGSKPTSRVLPSRFARIAFWNIDQVAAGLQAANVDAAVVQILKDRKVDGRMLSTLNDESLQTLGVASGTDRKAVLFAVEQMLRTEESVVIGSAGSCDSLPAYSSPSPKEEV
ncbi:hypothetical protein HDU97_010040 [Phlyctochytrium planicorne]|nr:hypothetical protein HDU97_010040 [Phlyctochytrium planicorne]